METVNDRPRILIVEDDSAMRESCRAILAKVPYHILDAASPREAEPILAREELDLVLTDMRMPDGGGQAVLQSVRRVSPEVPVVIITAYPSVDSAVELFKNGIVDYLTKPFTVDQLRKAVDAALKTGRATDRANLLRRMEPPEPTAREFFGRSTRTLALLADIRRVARMNAHVLISGEPGSGKELAARMIHLLSSRSSGFFAPSNCASVPDDPNAFRSLLERAGGGTLFLDEVTDLGPAVQPRILAVPVGNSPGLKGGQTPQTPDVRILAATQKDLQQEARSGRFREDVYYHLSGLELRVPPLRERADDIPELAIRFLDRLQTGANAPRITGFTEEALNLLVGYPWPGNMTELENVIRKALSRSSGPMITIEGLFESGMPATAEGSEGEPAPLRRSALTEYERKYLVAMLADHSGNVTQTAQALGVHRTTLQRLMKKYGIGR